MIIAIHNFKGGSGSTTMSLLLANYLTTLKKQVFLIDMTSEGSLAILHSRSILLEERLPFDFFRSDIAKAPLLMAKLKEEKDAILLIDLPRISSFESSAILEKINSFVIPFQYGTMALPATIQFALSMRKLSPGSRQIFVANMILENSFSDQIDQQQELLRKIGDLSSPISFYPALTNMHSMHIPAACLFECSASLQLLFERYLTNE